MQIPPFLAPGSALLASQPTSLSTAAAERKNK